MKKPWIGLTPSHDTTTDDLSIRPTYMRALKAAGAIPVVLPLEADDEDLKDIAGRLDGFLFTGGPDVHPFLFGEQTLAGCGKVSAARDKQELALLPLIMRQKKPILGICRGIQILNIGLGGDIYQDIGSQWKGEPLAAHMQPYDYHIPSHTVELTPGSRLAQISGRTSLKVNSMHHQAIRQVSSCLNACGYAPGRLVEALEMPDYPFFIGVQWHPEYLWQEDAAAARLFEAFVEAARR